MHRLIAAEDPRRELFAAAADDMRRAVERAAYVGASLRGVDLAGVDLRGAFLPGVDLQRADLEGADLRGACLRGADLADARLAGANLADGQLGGALLGGADARLAVLRRADLRGARLAGADFRMADLTRARLDDAVLDWRWAAFAIELLRSGGAGLAGPIVPLRARDECPSAEPYGWADDHLRHYDDAIAFLAGFVRPGDDAPELLRRAAGVAVG